MDDEAAIAAARARDQELARERARQRAETERERLPSLFERLSDPEYIRSLALRHGQAIVRTEQQEAEAWAAEHIEVRLTRLRRAGVALPEDELYGVACLMAEPLDEPPVDHVHELRIAAVARSRAAKHPHLPPYFETVPLKVMRTTLRARARKMLQKPFVALLGDVGVSKSSAAAHAIASVHQGAHIHGEVLCGIWSSFDREHQQLVDRLRTASVVSISEITPKLVATRGLGEILSSLVEYRRGAGKITVFDSNMAKQDIARAFTKQAVSRMRGQVEWVWESGEDLRKRRTT